VFLAILIGPHWSGVLLDRGGDRLRFIYMDSASHGRTDRSRIKQETLVARLGNRGINRELI
jgi:hypothetical protein